MTAQPKTVDLGEFAEMKSRLFAMGSRLIIVKQGLDSFDPCYLTGFQHKDISEDVFFALSVCIGYMESFGEFELCPVLSNCDYNENMYACELSRYVSNAADAFHDISWALRSDAQSIPSDRGEAIALVACGDFLKALEALEKAVRPYLKNIRCWAAEKINDLSQLLIDEQKLQ
jgi:hypothetical protein